MNKHAYLRAYLAGIAVPTVFLMVIMTFYSVLRYAYGFPVPVERVIVFPMAVVPNIWGLWNILYLALRSRRHLPLGLHGAILPFLLAPAGYLVTRLLDFAIPSHVVAGFPFVFPIGLALYYLAWKYLVGFLNAELGIA
ncbi:MAG TPA: hypothetical protein VHE23_06300 [Candidatus Acidoferrales bacterium]|nr:hypothetical protein [Candidatus Acidoferrales bacterium]